MMTREEVFERVKKIVIEALNLAETTCITETTTLYGDLRTDSLEVWNVLLGIEDQFSIDMPEEDAEKIMNGYISDLINYIIENQTTSSPRQRQIA